ncbi:hypothetical protein LGN17_02140 [Burkholderia sp. AU30280]|uniref:hypothetical protein n=1 Tax=Burkholderia sp. AU30280 TaxID=2879628 RepID=UPI001CF53B0A|nr:hypothetical protein [Burkholderia sp. AU30280]MCA8271320.1 hypothetical protein [Burkholderia sp. AU30280]
MATVSAHDLPVEKRTVSIRFTGTPGRFACARRAVPRLIGRPGKHDGFAFHFHDYPAPFYHPDSASEPHANPCSPSSKFSNRQFHDSDFFPNRLDFNSELISDACEWNSRSYGTERPARQPARRR